MLCKNLANETVYFTELVINCKHFMILADVIIIIRIMHRKNQLYPYKKFSEVLRMKSVHRLIIETVFG